MFDVKSAATGAIAGMFAAAATAPVAIKMVGVQAEPVPIAVVSYGDVADQIPPGTSPARVDEMMAAVQTKIRKLGAAGFLVLDKNAVLYAPPATAVSMPLLLQDFLRAEQAGGTRE